MNQARNFELLHRFKNGRISVDKLINDGSAVQMRGLVRI
jgi:hypothetical protein